MMKLFVSRRIVKENERLFDPKIKLNSWRTARFFEVERLGEVGRKFIPSGEDQHPVQINDDNKNSPCVVIFLSRSPFSFLSFFFQYINVKETPLMFLDDKAIIKPECVPWLLHSAQASTQEKRMLLRWCHLLLHKNRVERSAFLSLVDVDRAGGALAAKLGSFSPGRVATESSLSLSSWCVCVDCGAHSDMGRRRVSSG